MNRKQPKIKMDWKRHEEEGAGRGSSRHLCWFVASLCHSDGAGGQAPDGVWASLMGVTLRLSVGCPGATCDRAAMIACVYP